MHPHGVFAFSMIIAGVQNEFNTVYTCISSLLVSNPIMRLFFNILHGDRVVSVSKSSLYDLMKSKKSLGMYPGGFEEASIHSSDRNRVYILKRYGMIKMALEHGYAICVCYTYGEEKTYTNIVEGLWKFRFWLNSYGIPGVVPWGCTYIPFMPRRDISLNLWISEPLQFPLITNPTEDDVLKWKMKYIDHLNDLHSRRKTDMGPPLEIW